MKAAEDQLTSKAGTKATPGMQHSIAGGCPAQGIGSGAAAPWSHGPGAGTGGAHPRSPRLCPRRQPRGCPAERCLPFTFGSPLRSPPPTAAESQGQPWAPSPFTAAGTWSAWESLWLQKVCPQPVSLSLPALRDAHAPSGHGGGR